MHNVVSHYQKYWHIFCGRSMLKLVRNVTGMVPWRRQPFRQPFRPKCTNRIPQKHHQNPVVPPESGVHPQNPVCAYSVLLWLFNARHVFGRRHFDGLYQQTRFIVSVESAGANRVLIGPDRPDTVTGVSESDSLIAVST